LLGYDYQIHVSRHWSQTALSAAAMAAAAVSQKPLLLLLLLLLAPFGCISARTAGVNN
jgi:hypothetical protein